MIQLSNHSKPEEQSSDYIVKFFILYDALIDISFVCLKFRIRYNPLKAKDSFFFINISG